ncbi:MAG: TIGR04076 family protein [Firmicutes bacterium]|jgi:uncharacterized repeat protein (TIGR04076 family)|nr:TIGR04076 family protein [Bacillota bacterium]
MYDLRVIVDEVRGFCDLPMQVGDYFDVSGGRITIPPGKFMCMWALQSMMPMLPVKQRRIADENDWLSSTVRVCCPDPNGMVIFRIERVGEPALAPGPRPRMLVRSDICAGCRACELVCSFIHERKFSDSLARIRVAKIEEDGVDRPDVCRQCGAARCVDACPAGALGREGGTGAITVDQDKCTGCRSCADACPFDAIFFHPEKAGPLICDLCGGDPQCVKRCPTGAIRFGLAGTPTTGGAGGR